VSRYAGVLCGVALAFATGCFGAGAAAAVPVPEGPRLAFTAMAGLAPSAFSVRTVGTDSSPPLIVTQGSRKGVVPRPLNGVAWSADGGLLAFSGSKGSRRGIYTVRPDGTGLRFLRGTRGGSNPVFSPDGRRIAFSREHLGKGLFIGTTPWVARADGGGRAHRLAEWRKGIEYTPSSFSPDGSALAVTRTVAFDQNQSSALLFALDGSGERRPLVRFPASEPVFSPDGSQIVLVRHSILRRGKTQSSHSDLFLVDPFGGDLRRLTDTRWIAETHPSWDPSGQRIAFTSFRISRDPLEALFDELLPFGNSIVQINADGTCREKLLSLRDAATYGAKWQPGQGRGAGRIDCGEPVVSRAPAGPRLAIVKFNFFSFHFDLETVGEAGVRPFPLAGGGEWKRPLPQWFAPPAWSADGSRLVFSGMARRLFGGPRGTRLYVVEADGTHLRPLRGTHGAFQPVFSPDGHTVAFGRTQYRQSRNKQGKKTFVPRSSSIWLADLAGGPPRRLTPVRGGHYMYPSSFSPDGNTLLATREVGNHPTDAVALALGGGGARTVVRHALDPIYSPDGSRIAFVRERSLKQGSGHDTTTLDLFTAEADGGGVRRLTSGPKDDVFQSWDPSGKRIAFVRYRPEENESDEIGIGSAVMEVNADGSCLRTALAPSRGTAFYGVAWQPGPGREAGRIAC